MRERTHAPQEGMNFVQRVVDAAISVVDVVVVAATATSWNYFSHRISLVHVQIAVVLFASVQMHWNAVLEVTQDP